MNSPQKISRCAIYTRKSTDHNLDLEFNSLDAQREACEAYIKSQAHEGWRLVPAAYDDGGISGASLDRPAIQALLTEIRAGKIDIVVVYKVDRLTRSLADFAELVELFDKFGVSFISITQSFNTTTSMGRLTLNVLLSFAQFEREVIGERVRDKISASKRKGIWVGGPVPLGYASVNKKLVIVPEEAKIVREIFHRYLELGAVRLLAADLDKRGIVSKRRELSGGRVSGGGRFGVGALSHFLKNRTYIGEIAYRGEIHAGEHEPILEREVFEQVQARLATNNVEYRIKSRGGAALLTGRIFDDRGNRMTPSHTTKKGIRYRYYVSNAVLQKRDDKIGSVSRVPAVEIEKLVLQTFRTQHNVQLTSEPNWDNDLLTQLDRVIVAPEAIRIHIVEGSPGAEQKGPMVISIPWSPQKLVSEKGVSQNGTDERLAMTAERSDAMIAAIAKARTWIDELTDGRIAVEGIALREGKGTRQIRLLLPLAFAAPRVVKAILEKAAPAAATITKLAQSLPNSWAAQSHALKCLHHIVPGSDSG